MTLMSVLRNAGAILILASAVSGNLALAAPPQTVTFAGPAIPGVCILNQQAVFTSSKVGMFANGRFKEMREAAQAAVNSEEAKINADAKALQAQKLPQEESQKRQQQLTKRFADLRAKAASESQGLEATRKDVVARIAAAAQPIIKQVYDQRKCGLLLARTSILAGNATMDITDAVISGLNVRVSTVSFDKQVSVAAKH